MSNLGMQLELSMTAKGVQATLKDAQGAIVQTANVVKSQLGGSGPAEQGISKFKEGIGRARETAMFFTASLGEFGPAGRTAQMALSGIAGAVMGGGGVLLALEGAQVAVRLLKDAWEAETKAAAESAKGLSDIKTAWDAFWVSRAGGSAATQTLIAQAKSIDQDKEVLRLMEERAQAQRELNDAGQIDAMTGESADIGAAQRKLADVEARLKARREELFGAIEKGARPALAAEAVDAVATEKAKADAAREAARVAAKEASKAEAAKQLEISKAADAGVKQRIDNELAEEQRGADERGRIALAIDESNRLVEERRVDRMSAIMQWETDWREHQEKLARETATKQIKVYGDIAEAAGKAFANMVTGAQSVKGAMADVLKSVVNMVIESIKTQVMANAVAAAAEAAKSQAGIPVVGPYLAAAAMITMLSLVQGLVGSIPSAAGGWERVPSDTMAMVHKDEQVLPAAYAEGLRNLVAGGGAGGTNVNVTIHAADAISVERLFMNNAGPLAKAIGRAVRDGRRFG